MDSTPAACAASPEWHWFWFWFGLLVLVNVATEIALCTIAATTRHLLVCMTSLGHHTIPPINNKIYNNKIYILIFLKFNSFVKSFLSKILKINFIKISVI